MKKAISKTYSIWQDACVFIHTSVRNQAVKNAPAIMFVAGVALLAHGLTGIAAAQNAIEFNDYYIERAVCSLYALIEGAFGALLTTVAGIGAIVGSAFGAYRAAISLIVVSCGAFILRSLVSLFFGSLDECHPGSEYYIRFPGGGTGTPTPVTGP
jgi:hypothetical protein